MAGGFRKCSPFLLRLRCLFSFKTNPSGSCVLPGSQERGADSDCYALRVGKPNSVPVNPGPKVSEAASPGGGRGLGRGLDRTNPGVWGPPSRGGQREPGAGLSWLHWTGNLAAFYSTLCFFWTLSVPDHPLAERLPSPKSSRRTTSPKKRNWLR